MGIVSLMIAPSILAWLAALWLLGVLLKRATPLKNGFIAPVLMAVGLAIGTSYGLSQEGPTLAYAAQGIALGALAIASYDCLHGIFKASAERTSEGEIMKKLLQTFSPPLIGLAVVAATSITVTIADAVVFGFYGIAALVNAATASAVIAVIVLAVNDVACKLQRKWQICYQYWLLIAFVCICDALFAGAWASTSYGQMSIALALLAAAIIGTLVFYALPYRKAVDGKAAVLDEVMMRYLQRHNVSASAVTLLRSPDQKEVQSLLKDVLAEKATKKEG